MPVGRAGTNWEMMNLCIVAHRPPVHSSIELYVGYTRARFGLSLLGTTVSSVLICVDRRSYRVALSLSIARIFSSSRVIEAIQEERSSSSSSNNTTELLQLDSNYAKNVTEFRELTRADSTEFSVESRGGGPIYILAGHLSNPISSTRQPTCPHHSISIKMLLQSPFT